MKVRVSSVVSYVKVSVICEGKGVKCEGVICEGEGVNCQGKVSCVKVKVSSVVSYVKVKVSSVKVSYVKVSVMKGLFTSRHPWLQYHTQRKQDYI